MSVASVKAAVSNRIDGLAYRDHIDGFDFLRAIAAFSVVWIHGSDTNTLTKSFQSFTSFAVPCFIMMSIFLTQHSCYKNSSSRYSSIIIKRIRRLVPSYLAWSLIYIIFRFAKRSFIDHSSLDVNWFAIIFFGGASYQLWFIPALLLWTIVFAPLILTIRKTDRLFVTGVLALFLAYVLFRCGSYIMPKFEIPAGYEMIKYMLGQTGYVFIGIGLWAIFHAVNKLNITAVKMRFLTIGILALGLFLISWKIGIQKEWFVPLYSTIIFIFSIYLLFPSLPLITKYLSPCSFGIYLSHGIFVEGFQILTRLLNIDIGRFDITLSIILVSFTCSAVLCIKLMQMRKARWLVV